MEYIVTSKTLDAKHFDGSLYFARYDDVFDMIEFERVDEEF
jgi:hypothetical protein